MARGKKKETLTPEERLQATLVPESEQPYPVPGNWCWVKVGTISKVKGGKRLPKGRTFLGEKSDYPYIRVTDFDNESISIENVKYIDCDTHMMIKNYTISSADIYISIAGTIGKVGIIPEELEGANLTENAAKITDINGAYQLYLMLFLKSEVAQNQMKDSTISTTQPKLALFRIEDILLPLPPLSEQLRVVDRIENLFVKLDEARQKAQDALDSFETRKAAILHKAFTGELTAQWRKEHGVGMESWETKPLGEFLELITYGFTNPMPDADIGPWKITARSIHDGYIDYSISRKTTQEAFDNLLTDKSRPRVNDVLLTKDGSIGRVSVVDRAGICINQSVALLRPTSKVKPDFLRDLLQSPEKQKIMELQSGGTALKHIYITRVDKMEISVPSLAEQVEICNLVNNFIAKEQQAKEAAEGVLGQIDLMKKAILARAFRGELGTNDPREESAVELLKQVL
ncbi:type I restriction modification DNA specificity domain protein [Clostridium sp. CAG:1013]|nr:type I restriction modification DNA specificity domain protein [Clostridium sp. CAG:1013]